MVTERPTRMVESSQASKWLSSNVISAFGSSIENKTTEELEIFLKGQKLHRGQANFIPSRSGSAPPSMEGSVAAVGNILSVKGSCLSSNSGCLGNSLEDHKSEGQWLFDPSYVPFCSLELNLEPKFPSLHLRSQIGNCKENQGITSSDNGVMVSLSTDKEELNKEGSPEQASENLFKGSSILKHGQNAASLTSLHKSLVDLIQEDFPRTPSPLYNKSHLTSHATTEDSIDVDVHAISSIDFSNLSDSATCSTSAVETGTLNINACELISNEVMLQTFPSSQHRNGTQSLLENPTCNKDTGLKDFISANGVMHTEEHKLRAPTDRRQKQGEQKYYSRNKLNQSFTHGYTYQIPGAGTQVISQGMNNSQSYLGMLAHSHSQFSSLGIQSSFPSPGITGPLYVTPTAFMTSGNPFYPNFESSCLFSPQYSLGGYALSSSAVMPYMAGYSSQGDLPLPFEAASSPNLNGQATSLSSEGVPNARKFQSCNKINGQHGLSLHPSYVNPLNMQYYPHPFGNAYPAATQQKQLASRTLTGGQVCSLASQEDSAVTTNLNGQKLQSPVHGSLTVPSSKNIGISGSSYFGDSSVGVMMQFPALSLGSPILPSSPRSGTNPLVGQKEKQMPRVSGQNAGFFSGQRGTRRFDDPKKLSFIKELKSINLGKFELSDIAGRIVEFSVDQHGSRFIQLKLESCSVEEKVSVFEEIFLHASKLMTDVFGNYVIQKVFAHGSPDQRKNLAEQLSGQILPLSLQMYGCRVIQKALEVIELDQKTLLVQELDGHVMRCVHDQNGNHVIQKCIECMPMDKIHFIISAFQGQVSSLSIHPYGCRVIQRVLEHCSDEQHIQIQCLVDEILESACVLSQDQYGNYVMQHVLERGKPHEKSQLISKLSGKIVRLSQHKYASNVIEKCLEHADVIDREALIEEIIGQPGEGDNLLTMMKDQFANYVIQKILEISNERHREILVNHIRVHIQSLKKYTYGKHIAARFEQLASPGSEAEVC